MSSYDHLLLRQRCELAEENEMLAHKESNSMHLEVLQAKAREDALQELLLKSVH